MVRCLALLAPLLVMGACAGTGSPNTAQDGVEVIGLDQEYHSATISGGWVNLRTLELNSEADAPEEDDLYVKGLVTGWVFAPDGAVVGPLKAVPEEAEFEETWLRLKDRSIHPRSSDESPPEGAVIAGVFDRDTELFYPRDRVITGARFEAGRSPAGGSVVEMDSGPVETDDKP